MNREGQRFVRCVGNLVNPCRRISALPRVFLTFQHALTLGFFLILLGCSRSLPPGGFVFTQVPVKKLDRGGATHTLDLRYPAGSRVVLANSDFKRLEMLSDGLFSAGDPQVTCDGKRVLFCAKAKPGAEWQVYEMELAHRRCRPLTAMPGGAASPALLADGRLLFVSPVTPIGETNSTTRSVLYSLAPGEKPKALTFTSVSVSDPIVLEDGRILFIGTRLSGIQNGAPGCALYTINNDGTEITEFSSPENGQAQIRRPRQIGGRIFYLVSEPGSDSAAKRAEFIQCARPFAAPQPVSIPNCDRLGSVQLGAKGTLLLTAAISAGATSGQSLAIYGMDLEMAIPTRTLFADPAWDSIEASELVAYPQPMGRLSTVDPTKQTGQILCLNVNYTSYETNRSVKPATRVRVIAEPAAGTQRVLGEIAVQSDGSFMAEVPADLTLGLEAIDDEGHLLRRLAPMVWVRPGENRSCIGCHEPPNHAPGNHRPLAVRVPVPRLSLDRPNLAQAKR